MNEWSAAKKWNPFNSYKLLAQVYRWRHIQRNLPIPQPALVTIDPINSCNLNCSWCNAEYLLGKNNRMLSSKTLMAVADFLPLWQGSPDWPAGVEAICIAGGGEPLLHPDISTFIDRLAGNGIEIGIVTNGTHLDQHLDALSKCTWVGVSVDAGTAATYRRLKQVDCFDSILNNIQQLTHYIATRPCRLGLKRSGSGVSFKYLMSPENIDEIIPAARLAKELGCTNFHLRPASVAWDKLSAPEPHLFRKEDIFRLAAAIEAVRPLENESFGIYGITHKFDTNLNPANHFKNCHAIFMTCVIMPPREETRELFRLGLCCDRRGDLQLEAPGLGREVKEIAEFWGSTAHWDLFDTINLADCPRCTYQPHNQIMEHVIAGDSMTYKFI